LIGKSLTDSYNPHIFLIDNSTNRTTALASTASQEAIAGFFASDGVNIPDPNAAMQQLFPVPLSVTLFETKTVSPLAQ
jgi:hypothetical protein